MPIDREALVFASWAQAVRRPEALATAFYARLFEIAPATRRYFAGTDMAAQQAKFTRMMTDIVGSLGTPRKLAAPLADLGARHDHLGIQPADYEPVREALLHALAEQLGPDFTPEVREGWVEAYARITAMMLPRGDRPGS